MNWNEHSDLKGKHAILSPSSISWIRYSNEDNYESLIRRCCTEYASQAGTIIHEYAQLRIINNLPMSDGEYNAIKLELIRNHIPEYAFNIESFYQTVKEYVNDAIADNMSPEVPLLYSKNCFGTADAIWYGKHTLKIYDLKTGTTPAHFEQLEIYAALFFLEYGKKMKIKPESTNMELRLYQLGEVSIYHPEPEVIYDRIDKIVELDPVIDIFKSGGLKHEGQEI